ncbi:UNVERIFIED_CONTAM: hypothetical protein FKN15_052601 [Acipenser sinensis]
MTMRSTVFKPGSLKIERDLNPEKLDFEKAQSGGCAAAPAAAGGINIKREPGELVLEAGHGGGLPVVLGNIHNSANQHPHYHSKSRKLKDYNASSNKAGSRTLSGVAGLNKAQGVCLGLGQEENWMSLGGGSNSNKQMGGDGAQAKNRNVFVTGQTDNNIKTATTTSTGAPVNTTANINNNSRELGGTEAAADRAAGGAGSLELNMEGRWKNAKKNPNHSPTQATCLRQILLLQLDLIEQQQQQLQAKDKEIDELKSEKETGSPLSPQPREEPRSSGVEPEELPFMSTTEMYLCRWQQPPPSPRRKTTSKKEESVAIPSWREHSMEPLKEVSPLDFIENLDDGVFLKRHAKLELDEKRRKRWDIQRIREQRMFQRLQQRMYKKKGIQESEPEVSSFYPETDDVESLMITPFLPVVAFGRPLPKLTQQNFELPWLDERSRCRIEMQKKQTPHRTCRK